LGLLCGLCGRSIGVCRVSFAYDEIQWRSVYSCQLLLVGMRNGRLGRRLKSLWKLLFLDSILPRSKRSILRKSRTLRSDTPRTSGSTGAATFQHSGTYKGLCNTPNSLDTTLIDPNQQLLQSEVDLLRKL
jgi:hypothetical protein